MILTLFGVVIGFLVALAETGAKYNGDFYFPQIRSAVWMDWVTVACSSLALISVFFIWKGTRIAMTLLTIAIVGGVAGALTVWEIPGTFLFAGLILLVITQIGMHDDQIYMGLQANTSEGIPDEAFK